MKRKGDERKGPKAVVVKGKEKSKKRLWWKKFHAF